MFSAYRVVLAAAGLVLMTPDPAPAQNDIFRLLDTLLQQPPPQQRRGPPPGYERIGPANRPDPSTHRPSASRPDPSLVRQVQRSLNALGYDAGPEDGVAGRRTLSAIAGFRQRYGLPHGDTIDASLMAALSVAMQSAPVSTARQPPLPAPNTGQPSFACGEARSQVERTICSSPELSAIEKELRTVYEHLGSSVSDVARQALRVDQQRWLAERNACGSDWSCIASQTVERTRVLGVQLKNQPSLAAPAAQPEFRSASGAAASGAAGTIRFASEDIRSIEPVLIGERLLTGFPVMMGDLKGTPIKLRFRDIPSTEIALALYLDLAMFKQWPELKDEPLPVYNLAERFLMGDLAAQYLAGCRGVCSPKELYAGWRGANEFERETTYRQFRSEVLPVLLAQAPDFPVPIRHVIEMELGTYDASRQVFPLQIKRPGANWDALFGTMGAARRLVIDNQYKLPTELPVAADEAPALLQRLGSNSRLAYLALDQRLDEPGWQVKPKTPRTRMIVERARLYADAKLQDQVYEFIAAEKPVVEAPKVAKSTAGQLKVEYWRNAVLIGGRLATSTGWEVEGAEDRPEGLDLRKNLRTIVRDYALADDPSWLAHDTSALSLLYELDPDIRAEIIEEALQRRLSESEKITLLHLNSEAATIGPLAGDPFAQRRAVEAIRKRADRIVPSDLPPQPIPLRVYCSADLMAYDFDTQSFPIAQTDCDRSVGSLNAAVKHGHDAPGHTTIPKGLSLPPDEAEPFDRLLSGNRRLIVSYETELTIKAERSEAGHRRTGELSPASHFWVHMPGRLTETLYRLDERKSPPSTDQASVGIDPATQWDVNNPDHRARLFALARPLGSLPADGQQLVGNTDTIYGTITARGTPFNPTAQDPGTAGLPFSGRRTLLDIAANALSVPREHLMSIANVREGEPMTDVLAILPAPYDTYVRSAPSGSYGETFLAAEATVAITGIFQFELPFEKPLLVLSLLPQTSRFVTGSQPRKVLETFDLTAPGSFAGYEVLPVSWRLANVVHAAEALGANVEEVVENVIRWPDNLRSDVFARREFVARLVEAGRSEPADDTIWLAGNISIGEYDFASQSFPIRSVELGHIDVFRTPELPASAMSFRMETSQLSIRMAPEDARLWASTYPPGAQIALRVHARMGEPALEAGAVSFKLNLLEAELLEKGSVLRLRDQQQILYRFDLSPPEAEPSAAESVEEAEPAPELAFDILGARLGTSLPDAMEKVSNELGDPTTYFATREAQQAFNLSAWDSYANATLLHDEQLHVMIALYSEPPAGENIVTGITRTQHFPKGERPHPDDLRELLFQKYGQPTRDQGGNGYFVWRSSQDAEGRIPEAARGPNCAIAGPVAGYAVMLNAAMRERDGGMQRPAFPIWLDAQHQPWTPPDAEPFDLRTIFAKAALCDEEMLVAVLITGEDGLVANFYLGLTTPADVFQFRTQNEALFRENQRQQFSPEVKVKF